MSINYHFSDPSQKCHKWAPIWSNTLQTSLQWWDPLIRNGSLILNYLHNMFTVRHTMGMLGTNKGAMQIGYNFSPLCSSNLSHFYAVISSFSSRFCENYLAFDKKSDQLIFLKKNIEKVWDIEKSWESVIFCLHFSEFG